MKHIWYTLYTIRSVIVSGEDESQNPKENDNGPSNNRTCGDGKFGVGTDAVGTFAVGTFFVPFAVRLFLST